MTKDKQELIRHLERRLAEVKNNENARYYCAKRNRKLNTLLNVPGVVLTAIVSGALFCMLQGPETPYVQKLIMAALSTIASILSGLQIVLQPQKNAEDHLGVAKGYFLKRLELEDLMAREHSIDVKELEQKLSQISTSLALMSQGAPEIPARIWRRFCEDKPEEVHLKRGV